MNWFGAAFILALASFCATNIDDILVLVIFFTDKSSNKRHIIFGQYLGFTVIILISLLGFLVGVFFPTKYVGFIGFIPGTIGFYRLVVMIWEGYQARKMKETTEKELGQEVQNGVMTKENIQNENEGLPLQNKDISDELKHEEFIRDTPVETQLLTPTITTVHIQTTPHTPAFKEQNTKAEEEKDYEEEEDKDEEASWCQTKCIQKFSWLIHPKVIQVSAITIANGGDNVSIYVPIFAASSWPTLLVILIIFYVMVGLWCLLALKLTQFKPIAALVSNYGHYFIPWVLMGLGV